MLPEFEIVEVWPDNEEKPYQVHPPGIHEGDEDEVRRRFVHEFPNSTSRPDIFRGFVNLRWETLGPGLTAIQWVNGSLISAKIDPADIDVVTFLDVFAVNGQDEGQRQFTATVLNGGDATKGQYRSHTFLVVSRGADHPYYPVYEHWRAYWLDLWSHTRRDRNSGHSHPKGFVRMPPRRPELPSRIRRID